MHCCTISLAVESHSPVWRVRKSSIPFLLRSRTKKRPVFLQQNSSGNPEMQISSFPLVVQSMSLHIDMKMVQLLLFFEMSEDLLKNLQWRKILGKYPTRTQLILHRFQLILCQKATSWVFPLDLRILHGIWVDTHFCFCPCLIKKEYWSRPSGKWTFQQFHMQNFFRMFQYKLLSENEQNLQFPRSSCSCRSPNSSNNSIQGGGKIEHRETHNVQQTKKIIPFVTWKTPFGRNVCVLVFGVIKFHWDLGFLIYSVEQPITRNFVGS